MSELAPFVGPRSFAHVAARPEGRPLRDGARAMSELGVAASSWRALSYVTGVSFGLGPGMAALALQRGRLR